MKTKNPNENPGVDLLVAIDRAVVIILPHHHDHYPNIALTDRLVHVADPKIHLQITIDDDAITITDQCQQVPLLLLVPPHLLSHLHENIEILEKQKGSVLAVKSRQIKKSRKILIVKRFYKEC